MEQDHSRRAYPTGFEIMHAKRFAANSPRQEHPAVLPRPWYVPRINAGWIRSERKGYRNNGEREQEQGEQDSANDEQNTSKFRHRIFGRVAGRE